MRSLIVLVVAAIFASPSSAARLVDLERCLGDGNAESRRGCLEGQLAKGAPSLGTIQRLHARAAEHAGPLVELIDLAEALPGYDLEDDPATTAAWKDLRGAALLELGRPDEAARALGAAVALDDGVIELTWFTPDGKQVWSTPLDSGSGRLERAAAAMEAAGKRDEARRLLTRALILGASDEASWEALGGGPVPGREFSFMVAGPWYSLLPDIDIPYFDGGKLPLRSARGSVVVLDFWASWCPPCLKELPHFQQLYEAQRENGLIAVAVNNNDPMETAQDLARELGLTMPIGAYDGKLHAAFNVEKLPTLIVGDREGRLRARWDGYRDGLEIDLATLVHELLEEQEQSAEPVAQVMLGDGVFSVDWLRQAGRTIESLAVFPGGPDDPRIGAGLSRSLGLFDRNGGRHRVVEIPTFATRLRQADLDGDGVDELIGFRPGRKNVVVLYTDDREHLLWEAPAPLLEVRLRASGEQRPGELLLGAIDGLYRADLGGETITPIEGLGEVSGLALVGEGDGSRLAAIGSGQPLRWLGPDYALLSEQPAPPAARTLIEGGTLGAGVASASVTAGILGRFVAEEEPLLAIGLASGQLVVLDPVNGAVRFRALFDPIRALAAVDLDGDGVEELVVAGGRKLALLRGHSTEAGSAGM